MSDAAQPPNQRRILVTGANGWIGRALCMELQRRGHEVTGLVRHAGSVAPGIREWLHTPADFSDLDAAGLRQGQFDAVIHTAARAHVMEEQEAEPLACYRAANTAGTLRLAEAARQAAIPRFVFVSSIKALGESEPRRPWRETDVPDPAALDPYGQSKHEAEEGLRALATPDFANIIVRPPLVYGPGVRANFLKLIELVDRGWPLPLGCATAPRSLVALDNLVDALICCATAPTGDITSASHRSVFHVADAQTLSVRVLIQAIGLALNKQPLLLPVPVAALRLAGTLTGRQAQIDRLVQPLRLDTKAIQRALGWTPPLSTAAALARTIAWYRSPHSRSAISS